MQQRAARRVETIPPRRRHPDPVHHALAGLEEARVYREPVISLDLFATFASLAGASLDDDVVRDGVDLLPYLTGRIAGSPHDVLYWRAGPN